MKKILFLFLSLALLPLVGSAKEKEYDNRAPGIYAIVDGESVPLTFTYGKVTMSGEDLHGVEVSYVVHSYKGETSGTIADSVFHLVLDPKNNKVVKQMKNYNPFIKSMKPNKVRIIPLTVNHETQCRDFSEGKKMDALHMEKVGTKSFESGQISENSYFIKKTDLAPGEYGFVFQSQDVIGSDYEAIFGFTIQ